MEFWLLQEKGDDDDFEFPAFQHANQVLRQGFFQFYRHLWCPRVRERAPHPGDIRSHGRDDTKTKSPVQLIFALSRKNLYVLGLVQYALRLLDDLLAEGGQFNSIWAPLEDRRAQFLFQLLDRQT